MKPLRFPVSGTWVCMLAGAALLSLAAPAAGSDAAKTKPASGTTTTAPPAAPQMTMKEAKQKLGIIVFPAKGQTATVQEADELACLQWAAEETGVTKNSMKDPKAAGAAAAGHVDSV